MATATNLSTTPVEGTDHGALSGDSRRWLEVYLRDHRAGATFGQALARRAAHANSGTELGRTLRGVAHEIEEDCRSLESIMTALGIRPSRMKMALAKVAHVLAHPKLYSPLTPHSPMRRVLQLEALTAGIFTKRHLWQALVAVSDALPTLDPTELSRLIDRADAQIESLEAHHGPAARAAFAP